MTSATANLAASKLINRVLSDYPLARERLRPHALAHVAVHVGPVGVALRITPHGNVEAVGDGGVNEPAPKVVFRIPIIALGGLLRKDPDAFREVAFEGDSELAQLLSVIARSVEWDIEEDLSRLLGGGKLGDIISHRVVGTSKSIAQWRDEAGQRFTENLAEYLVHEREALITKDQLEQMTRDNEMLRDDVARLEARLHLLTK
jgi:ubiquinone biosynthesis protein UbiJ